MGPQGPSGPRGLRGESGPPGNMGATGQQGDIGNPGGTGATGSRGGSFKILHCLFSCAVICGIKIISKIIHLMTYLCSMFKFLISGMIGERGPPGLIGNTGPTGE